MSNLIGLSFHNPDDNLILTATVRDLHAAYPGKYTPDIRTSTDDLWQKYSRVIPLKKHDSDILIIDMHYPLIPSNKSTTPRRTFNNNKYPSS